MTRKLKPLPPRTPEQEARRQMLMAPIRICTTPGKSWGGRLITRTELPTEGRRLFKLEEEDMALLLRCPDVTMDEDS